MPEESAVRPLNDHEDGERHHHPLRLVVGVAALLIGGALGWLAASSAGSDNAVTAGPDAAAEATAPTILPRYPGPTPAVDWSLATAPLIPPELEYRGASEVVELEGRMYLVVNTRDPATDVSSGELWQSDDGLEWVAEPLLAEEAAVGLELTAVGNTLLLAGRTDDGFALWQSIPGRAIGGSSWNRIQLEVPDSLERSFLQTAVNSSGEIMTTLIGELRIWPEIIAPFVPPDIDLDDPAVSYRGDSFLYLLDEREEIQLFQYPPEVVITADSIWIRLITTGGDEVLQTVELPRATYPVGSNPTLATVPVAMAWISRDGIEFLPVVGRNALPDGYFLPEPWGDRFVTAAYELEDSFAPNELPTLWMSGSGRAWQTATQQPPSECSPFFFATSGGRMHLTSDEGVQCVRDIGSPWEVLEEASSSTYVMGGPSGFIAYPDSFEYDTALFSRDGITWTEIELPGAEPYPRISMLQNRLIAMSAYTPRPNAPLQIDIWVGEIR